MADADTRTILVRRLVRLAKTSPEMPCPREPEGPQGLGEVESARRRTRCQANPSNESRPSRGLRLEGHVGRDGIEREAARVVRGDEAAGEIGIELAPGAAPDLLQRVAGQEAVAVGALRGHRVERVHDRDQARLERDLRPDPPGGVAVALPRPWVGETE